MAALSNSSDVLKIVVPKFAREGAEAVPGWIPKLTYYTIPVTSGKRYRAEVEMRSQTESSILLAVDGVSHEWRGYGARRLQLTNEWNVCQFEFATDDSKSKVVLQFREFEPGVYEFRRASFREIK